MKSTTTPEARLALTERIHQLKADLDGLQSTITSETKAAEIARDGFDRWDIKNAALVPELSKRGAIPDERLEAFQDFQRGRLADLLAAKKDIELSLAEARSEWQAGHNAWRIENAEPLLAEAEQHVRDLDEKIAARQQDQQGLRQKIAQITTARTQRDAAMAAHDAAVALAIAQGTAAPEAPSLPEMPAETVQQLEGAIKLIGRELDELKQGQQRSAAEVRALLNLVNRRKVDEFTAMMLTAAEDQGVRLGDLRDKLVELAGPTVSASIDADNAAYYRAEADRLRPEVERLRADVATLQNGVAQLAARRYG